MRRDQFVMTARSFIGTPFRHQGRLPGTALDCGGLVMCAAAACGFLLEDMHGYSATPSGGKFIAAVEAQCERIALEAVLPGDLMVFAFQREPQHVAIVTQTAPLQIVHAWQEAGLVAENGLDEYWSRRLRGCYRLRGAV